MPYKGINQKPKPKFYLQITPKVLTVFGLMCFADWPIKTRIVKIKSKVAPS
ncbi:hypothetical protein KUL156_20560 [Alteromonas sp. KUL156]|nr:hypothetical protein KUL106_34550 [Alteromonas sp. KUL106]GFD96721.1 hypothetical protein KUL154_54540 [Alteromonas sp. KUL154]GFD99463.1 hypothetical protein KUL156_20560 [Alteromonas sp. KUL156]